MTKIIFTLFGEGQKLGKSSFSKKVDFQVWLKIDQNGKLVSLKKTFSNLPRKTAQNGQMTEAREKVENNNVACNVATNRYVIRFSK